MSGKIAQTMVTLAEDNREFKTSLRLMLKYEVQHLLERLQELGEESVLLFANSNEGTAAKLGTSAGADFLSTLRSNFNLDLRNNFLKFCTDGNGGAVKMGTSQQQNYQGDGFLQQQLNFSGMNSIQSLVAKQQQGSSNRFSPYGAAVTQQTVTQSTIQPDLPNFWNTLARPATRSGGRKPQESTGSNQNKRKRNVCRHFVGKGHCWQGARCSFLHTQDPEVLATLGISVDQASADSSQVTQSDENLDTNAGMKGEEEESWVSTVPD